MEIIIDHNMHAGPAINARPSPKYCLFTSKQVNEFVSFPTRDLDVRQTSIRM